MTWLLETRSYLPPRTLHNEDFSAFSKGADLPAMFRGTHERRRIERNDDVAKIFAGLAHDLTSAPPGTLESNLSTPSHSPLHHSPVDTILTNVSIPDLIFTGCGAMVAKHLKLKPKTVIDFHNGGCVSPVLLLEHADLLIQAGRASTVLICVAQTAGHRVFEQGKNPDRPQALVPGDGAFIWLVTADNPGKLPAGKLIGIQTHCFPEYSEDMGIRFDSGKKYWEAAPADAGYVDFDPHKMAAIGMRGNRLVPRAMQELLNGMSLTTSQINGLVTNQPNPVFLRNWREFLQLPKDRHFETFESLGNLFQAGIGINLDLALRDKKIHAGEKIMLAGFSHAGDYSGAALLQY